MKNKLGITKQEKKVLTFWGFGLIIIIALIVIINFFFPIKNILSQLGNNSGEIDNNKYVMVSDFTRYSTVSTAINKYYSFINMKDYDSVLKILDEDFVTEKNLNKNNINTGIYIPSNLAAYEPNIMYEKKKKGIVTYYVDGYVVGFSTSEKYRHEYLKVILDGNNFHFSIKPIDEGEFKEVSNG